MGWWRWVGGVGCGRRSTKPHSPGLPGDEEEAVVGGIDPVGASLAHGDPASAIAAAAAAAAVVLLWDEESHGVHHSPFKTADGVEERM